jgi:VanZ family protein
MYKVEYINKKMAAVLWFCTITYMILIFYLSSRQHIPLPDVWNADKLLHLMAYVPMSFMLYVSLKVSGLRRYIAALAFLISVLYGVSDELHQALVPGRTPDVLDLAADTIGSIFGVVIAGYISGR